MVMYTPYASDDGPWNIDNNLMSKTDTQRQAPYTSIAKSRDNKNHANNHPIQVIFLFWFFNTPLSLAEEKIKKRFLLIFIILPLGAHLFFEVKVDGYVSILQSIIK